MPEVRLCPKGYGAAGMASKTEFEEISVQFRILQNGAGGQGTVSSLLLDGCDAVDVWVLGRPE
jgi:hypothetical protein